MSTYPSKVDAWLIALLTGVAIALLAAFCKSHGLVAGLLALVAWAAFVCVLIVPCRYALQDDHLTIRAGLKRWHIPYASIRNVKPSRSFLAAPALSLDRVEISYGQFDSVLVSPVKRQAFIDALSARLPTATETR